jgi:dTDP-4-amino-4,6-dideoxygalactose transaminase
MAIQMVDLRGQYLRIKDEVDAAIARVLESTQFIKGEELAAFEAELSAALDGVGTLGVANGTDALQIAFMALGIRPGDEVITPSFTFVATAEAIGLLGATPVFADIDPDTFNIDPAAVESLITERTKAIVPVHLFGQCADLDPILELACSQDLAVIEDTAQAVGARYKGRAAGTMGGFGTLSFFPSKNLGCYGDGGGILSSIPEWLEQARLIANHGSRKKYHNEVIGINSRLDAMQAAILRAKLPHLDAFTAARQTAADRYDDLLSDIQDVIAPRRADYSTHVFHQYTIRVVGNDADRRDALKAHLNAAGIPCNVYYPIPLHLLPIYKDHEGSCRFGDMTNTLRAANEVLSLPMHTELTLEEQQEVATAIRSFFHV